MKSDKREKAIKYLTEEIRSLRMAPQINGCGPENWAEQLEIMETCLEAVRAYTPAHIDRGAWVSVEDRLPEDNKDGETVLVIVSGKPHENITLHRAIMTAGYFQGEGWVVNEYPEWESPEVTYWMPLPEPPESRPLEEDESQ